MSERQSQLAPVQTAPWPPVCWVVTDGILGRENQCIGLAEAMGLHPVVKRLRLGKFWRELSLYLGWARRFVLRKSDIQPPWPDMLITAGRTSLVASLYVKQASGGRTFTVYIQTPVVSASRLDRVIVPEHDRLRGDNVIRMTGSLHRVTPEFLRSEAAKWAPRFAHLPRPHVAVLLGGNNAVYRLGSREIAEIGGKLARLARIEKVGLLVTGSPRTGAANMAQLRALLRDCEAVIWDGEGENPYYGMLALADSVIATCDSINMICEACSTGKPVHMLQLPGYSDKFSTFHRNLLADDRIRLFNGTLEHWHYEPMREKDQVAATIRQAYETHRC